MRRAAQTSESVEVAVLLALSGGLMDAYSYLVRGGVFANAQTGNMLLLGISITQGDWDGCLRYATPIASFAVGVAVAQCLKLAAAGGRLHWRQLALGLEVALLVAVALVPASLDLVANDLTSLACGIQVQAFRKLHGRAVATTMCVGNLRSGTDELVTYLHTRDRAALSGALLRYLVICCFVAGAVLGNLLVPALGLRMVLANPVLLACAFAVMFWDREAAEGAGG